MADTIPQWAKERAGELARLTNDGRAHFANHVLLHAFARYISEHEEPPVDPLLTEALVLLDRFAQTHGDSYATELIVLAALKRGMELAK